MGFSGVVFAAPREGEGVASVQDDGSKQGGDRVENKQAPPSSLGARPAKAQMRSKGRKSRVAFQSRPSWENGPSSILQRKRKQAALKGQH